MASSPAHETSFRVPPIGVLWFGGRYHEARRRVIGAERRPACLDDDRSEHSNDHNLLNGDGLTALNRHEFPNDDRSSALNRQHFGNYDH